jgi:hypothetical protein
MPIIPVHEPFWRGLVAWLLQVVSEPREVVDAIFNFCEKRGFEPSPADREVLLNL